MWSAARDEILIGSELTAVESIHRSIGLDLLAEPKVWEHLMARYLGGNVTPHKALHDVEVTIWGRVCRAEVKFSNAFWCSYTPINGKDWSRFVFKWALPRGNSGKEGVDVCLLIGRDIDDRFFLWVVPVAAIAANCASITVVAPSARTLGTNSKWDQFAVPFDVALPAFAAACHNRYDAAMRRAGIKVRAKEKMAAGDLLETVTS